MSQEAKLCDPCEGRMFTDDVGDCSGSGGKCTNTTPSSSFAFCDPCAIYEGACPACGMPHDLGENPGLYAKDLVTETEKPETD